MRTRRCPAVVFAGCGKPEIRQVIVPSITDEEILVRSVCTGISVGTERWYLTGKVKGVAERYPLIPGYQRIGIVEEAGSAVQTFKPGDRVWLGAWAMRLDPSDGLSGGGSHSQYAVAHHSRALPVPATVATEEAALATLAAVGLVGLEMTPAKLDDLAVVIGQGIVGLMSAQLARLTGAYVVTSDLIERRVALSRTYCADLAVNASTETLADVVHRLNPDGADLVIDTSGNSKLFSYDVGLLRRPGKLCLQGYFPEPIQVDFHDTHWKRTTVAFPMGFDMDGVKRAFQLLERKRLTISPLISHRIKSDDALEAYLLLAERPDEIVGMVLLWE
jgi:2-desacetyl-2-hydroxyethyl bacteriochlorophyllide A dehydrogenase